MQSSFRATALTPASLALPAKRTFHSNVHQLFKACSQGWLQAPAFLERHLERGGRLCPAAAIRRPLCRSSRRGGFWWQLFIAAAAWGGKIGRAAPARSTGFGPRNGAPASQQVHSTPAVLETNAIHFLPQLGPAPVTEAEGQLVPWGKRS